MKIKTRILHIDSGNPQEDKLNDAADVIRNGGLVAFPTETVYGLGADGSNIDAVKKIFIAKGRPADNPLIVHVFDISQVKLLVKEISKNAIKLMNRFWPGPLTLIFKKSKIVSDLITCGLDSVAIRMPNNKIALRLIEKSNCFIPAPSANISGKPSPTDAKHVIEDLNGKIDLIIDAGNVDIGIESTVVDLTSKIPVILRHGKITLAQIEEVIGKVNKNKKENVKKPKSPGMKYRHYAPNAKVIIVKDELDFKKLSKKYKGNRIKFLKYSNEVEMAKNLFKDFRDCDNDGFDFIFVVAVKDKGFGKAIMDRLRKASK